MYHVAHSDLLMQKELPYEVHFGHSEPPAPGGFIGESEIHSGHSTSSATGGVIDESFGWSSRNECGTIPIREIRPQYPRKNPFHELDNDMFMDKHSGICHTDSRTNFVREDNQMSYIGIMVSKKGIAAFGDSKSSRKVGTNYYEEGEVQKVFRSQQFLLAAAGGNEYVKNGSWHAIEELLNEKLLDFTGTHKEFVKILEESLRDSFCTNKQLSYHFLFGFFTDKFEERLYGCESCEITSTGVYFQELLYQQAIIWRGFENYIPKNPIVDPNWDIAKMADICHDFVASAIALGDKCLPYNPVGGEIQVETLS